MRGPGLGRRFGDGLVLPEHTRGPAGTLWFLGLDQRREHARHRGVNAGLLQGPGACDGIADGFGQLLKGERRDGETIDVELLGGNHRGGVRFAGQDHDGGTRRSLGQ